MKNIKNFFKKKEAELKFKTGTMSGGHKLGDDSRSSSSSSSNPRNASNSAYIPPERTTGPDRKVAEAALARLQGNAGTGSSTQRSQGQTVGEKSTFGDLMNEEKKKLLAEAKAKDEQEERKQQALREEQATASRINPLKAFDESQLFQCPILFPDPESSYIMKDLTARIKSHIFDTFSDDSLMRSAMIMFNCNRSPFGGNESLQPCLDILKKITTNLQNAASEEELAKFSRIRKSKIEKTVLALDGSLDFLFAIGFSIDKNDIDWIQYEENFAEVSSKMKRIGEMLQEPQIFSVILDRQVRNLEQNGGETSNADDDVRLSGSDVKRLQQGLERQREINEMFVSRATKDKLISGVGLQDYRSKFTVLRFRMPIADDIETVQANFRTSEKFGDVRQWFAGNFGEFFEGKTISFRLGTEALAGESDGKDLTELKLVPAATLHVLLK